MTIARGQHGNPSIYCLPSGAWRADVRVRTRDGRVKIVAAQCQGSRDAAIDAMWDKVRVVLDQGVEVIHRESEEPCVCQTAFTCMAEEHEPSPVDWPARLLAAAEAAEKLGSAGAADDLRAFAARARWAPPHVVEAIGRELMGDEGRDR